MPFSQLSRLSTQLLHCIVPAAQFSDQAYSRDAAADSRGANFSVQYIVPAAQYSDQADLRDAAAESRGAHFSVRQTPKPDRACCVSFAGSQSASDWETNTQYATKSASKTLQTSAEVLVHEGYLDRLQRVIADGTDQHGRSFEVTVNAAQNDGMHLLLTGHSSGGGLATLAGVWALQRGYPPERLSCITFGAPPVGNTALAQLVQREGWADSFLHVVARHDIVPRYFLAAGLGAKKLIAAILSYPFSKSDSAVKHRNEPELQIDYQEFVAKFLRTKPSCLSSFVDQSLSVASAAANMTASLVERGQYRPFGNYLFLSSTGNRLISNPGVIFQMLYLTLKESSKAADVQAADVIQEHRLHAYELGVQSATSKKGIMQLEGDPLLADIQEAASVHQLCMTEGLRQVSFNLQHLEKMVRAAIAKTYDLEEMWMEARNAMDVIKLFASQKHPNGIPYYEAYRLQLGNQQELAKVEEARRVLTCFWGQVMALHAAGQLPESFLKKDSVWLTRGAVNYQPMCEPLDIANYYRNSLWQGWLPGEAQYLEANNRPAIYGLLERKFTEAYPGLHKSKVSKSYASWLAEQVHVSDLED